MCWSFRRLRWSALAWKRGAGDTIAARLWDGFRRIWPYIVLMAVISAGTAGWLVWGHQAFALENRETRLFFNQGLPNALSPAANFINVMGDYSCGQLGWRPFFTVLIVGLLADALNRQQGMATR